MNNIHSNNVASALVRIDACHAEIHQSRRETEEMLTVLHTISTRVLSAQQSGEKTKHTALLHISEAAQSVGVRVSAIRIWEENGRLQPQRDQTSKYRLYDEEQMRRLHIIALLRKTAYNFEALRPVLQELAEGTPELASVAAEKRLQELAQKRRRCVEATAALWAYLENIGYDAPSLKNRNHSTNSKFDIKIRLC